MPLAGNEVQWLKDHMGGAVSERCFELIAHLASGRQGETLFGNSGTSNLATEPFQLFTLMGVGGNPGVQTESI